MFVSDVQCVIQSVDQCGEFWMCSWQCAQWGEMYTHSVEKCAQCGDVQLAEETSYGVQTVLAHATTLEDDDNELAVATQQLHKNLWFEMHIE